MRKSFVFSPKMNSIQFKVLFRRYMKQICTNVWTIVPVSYTHLTLPTN